jgi:putative AdoMet-dependent methyltransferase
MQNHGRFFLKDIVYSFDVENYREFFTDWVSGIHKVAGTERAQDLQFAIRDEYSTLDWIMEEILQRAGFNIDKREYFEGFMAVYLCTRCDDN